MENGNAYLKMNDYYRAEMEFMEAIREYPGKASGYEGLIRTITRDYTIFLIENQGRVLTLLDKMMAIAKESEMERLSKMIKENATIAAGALIFAFFLQNSAEKSLG